MEILVYVYIFIAGLCFGSFYNVVGLRVPIKKSIVRPRSSCTRCQRKLSPIELIPLISYLSLRGKCKGCQTKVSSIYPTMEVITATLFTISPIVVGWSKELLVAWLLISLLVIISISDISYTLIPDKILLFFGILILIVRSFLVPLDPWWDMFLGAGIGFSLLLFIAIVSKGGMGGGDIKLFAVLGLFLGWKGILLTLFISSLYGGVIGGVALLMNAITRKQPIPFGPSIALGAITTYFVGDHLLSWYTQYI
jgi:leader peptidase (prepilin peptidase)/N-methyltransferase